MSSPKQEQEEEEPPRAPTPPHVAGSDCRAADSRWRGALGVGSAWRLVLGFLLLLVPLLGGGQPGWAQAGPALQSTGALATMPPGSTGNDLRSRLGSLLAASDGAWAGLMRDERAVLLDGEVRWEPYVDLAAADAALAAALDPVAFAALEAAPDAELDAWQVNGVVLDLPRATLANALADREPTVVTLDDDIILVVDHVVVGAVLGAAELAADLPAARVDDRGLLGLAADTAPMVEPAASTTVDLAPAAATAPNDSPAGVSTGSQRAANGRLIPAIRVDELPGEALDTLALIARGGPFPFRQDGAVFGNFEGNLPAAPAGFYREYTVISPGEDDRGARRIVTGDDDRIIYYTDDHYDSFAEVRLDD